MPGCVTNEVEEERTEEEAETVAVLMVGSLHDRHRDAAPRLTMT